MTHTPRVTLGVATYERDTYLAEAVASCLRQTYDDLEVLVVLDGGSNPNIGRDIAGFDDPRLRLVRHERNGGIAEAYNTRGSRDGRRGRHRPRRLPRHRDPARDAVPGRVAALHAAAELYVPLHAACAGHLRLAAARAARPAELGLRLAARAVTHAA